MKIAITVEDLTSLALAKPQVAEVGVYDGSHLEVPKTLGEEIDFLLACNQLHGLALSALRHALIGQVDNAAETARLKYITSGYVRR